MIYQNNAAPNQTTYR